METGIKGKSPAEQGGTVRIGEVASLEAAPLYQPLKKNYGQSFYSFQPMDPPRLEDSLKKGQLDLGLASPATFAAEPNKYLILPSVGLGCKGPNGFCLLFSDILLDDLDEMTVSIPAGVTTSTMLIKVILGKYLQYTTNFETNWAKAEAHILVGDSALRERKLSRYNYIYDLGELWRYYTEKPMVFSMWMVRADRATKKKDMIRLFYKSLMYSLEETEEKLEDLAESLNGYEWMGKQDMVEFWKRIDYRLSEEHFEGLKHFYQDAYETGLIENTPELDFLDVE